MDGEESGEAECLLGGASPQRAVTETETDLGQCYATLCTCNRWAIHVSMAVCCGEGEGGIR